MNYYIFVYSGIFLAILMTFFGGLKDVRVKDHHINISKYHYWSDAKFILLLVIIILLISIDKKLTK
jgi:hypothetical protein